MEDRSRAGRLARGTGLVVAGAVGATALTGIAMAQDDETAETAAGSALTAAEGAPDEVPAAGLHRRGFAAPGTGPLLHGEHVMRTEEGQLRDITVQNGTLSAVSASSISVVSSDGFTAEYAIDADTRIRIDRSTAEADALTVGRPTRVIASQGSALRIGSTTPEGQAKAEGAIRQRGDNGGRLRERIRELVQQRLDEAS